MAGVGFPLGRESSSAFPKSPETPRCPSAYYRLSIPTTGSRTGFSNYMDGPVSPLTPGPAGGFLTQSRFRQ